MIVIANNNNAIQFDDKELIQICINNNWQSIYPEYLIQALKYYSISHPTPEPTTSNLIAF